MSATSGRSNNPADLLLSTVTTLTIRKNELRYTRGWNTVDMRPRLSRSTIKFEAITIANCTTVIRITGADTI